MTTIKNMVKPLLVLLLLAITLLAFATIINAGAMAADLDVPQSENKIYIGEPEQNPIILWINFFINVFSVVVLAGSAVMIAVAGIQYTAARDNAQGVQAAKQKITNVILGLLAYFFFFGFIQWLIPGGVF